MADWAILCKAVIPLLLLPVVVPCIAWSKPAIAQRADPTLAYPITNPPQFLDSLPNLAPPAPPIEPAAALGPTLGDWSMLAGFAPAIRHGHAAAYDPVRKQMVVFGGYHSFIENVFNDVWTLALDGPTRWAHVLPTLPFPSARYAHMLVYDPPRDRFLMLAGVTNVGPADEVWSLSLSGTPAWTLLAVAGAGPLPRDAASVVYDPVRDRLLLFGGYDGSVWRNDLWALNLSGTPAWQDLSPSGPLPPPRNLHAAVYDPLRDRMVVFGGNNAGVRLGDLWQLALAGTPAWSVLGAAGTPPSPRVTPRAIYDPAGDRLVLVGGDDGSLLSDVWELRLGGSPAWGALAPAGTPPPGRHSHTLVYDPVGGRAVLFAGFESTGSTRSTRFLSLGGSPAWSGPVADPAFPDPRHGQAAVLDAARQRLLVFGGFGGVWTFASDFFNDLWELPLAGAPVWFLRTPAGSAPSPRFGHSAVLDAPRDRVIVFGGFDAGGFFLGDVWQLSLAGGMTWSPLAAGGTPPSPRDFHSAIVDPVRDRMVVFGGNSYSGRYSDTWALPLGPSPAWAPLATSGTPPSPRMTPRAIYDPVGDRMLIFGGYDGAVRNDLWQLDFRPATPTWTHLSPAGPIPSPRHSHSLVYDQFRKQGILFGGNNESASLADAWRLELAPAATWTPISAAGGPPSRRHGHSAIYDSPSDRLIVYGGATVSGPFTADTWGLAFHGQPTPVLASLVHVDAAPDRVRLIWSAPTAHGAAATLYRRVPDVEWDALAAVAFDGTGRLEFEDRSVQPGRRYGYRVSIPQPGESGDSPVAWVDVPVLPGLAIESIAPNPAEDFVDIRFSLPDRGAATVSILDLAGRQVAAERIEASGAGSQRLRLAMPAGLPPGLCFLRVVHGGQVLTSRLAIVK